jgi:hypothetical protein
MQSIQSADKGACVVTFDVAGSLQLFRSKGILVPRKEDQIFAKLNRILLDSVGRAFGDADVVAIQKDELRAQIWKSLNELVNGHAVLVTCSEMASLNPDPNGLNLSINRLFDEDGAMLGYGPRPGYEYLSKQFDDLVRKIASRPVVLAKEGAFRGNTCCYILDELEKRGVSIVVLVMGFCDIGAKAQIQQKFKGEFIAMMLFDRLVEWIADRDLIPFMPGCGRVMGRVSIHSFMPVRSSEGFSCAFPYILPFGKTEKWMSLKDGHASELSAEFLDYSVELFNRIEQESGYPITVGRFLGDNPRVSMPVSVVNSIQIPDPNTRIIEFLEQVRKKV